MCKECKEEKEVKKEKVRWVDLSELPKYESGKNKGGIDWSNSVGYKVPFIYECDNGEVEIIKYKNKKVTVKVNEKIKDIATSNFIYGGLGGLLGKITKNFKIEIGTTLKDEKRDITIIDRKHRKDKNERKRKYYKYKCNNKKCGFSCEEYYKNGEYKKEYWIEESSLIRGNGCACCCVPSQIVVPDINSIVANEETYWMIPYFQGGWDKAKMYTPQSSLKLKFKCPDCGRVKNKPLSISNIYTNHSIGCQCGDKISYPSKIVYNLLEQLNVDFKTEYSPEWISPRLYDFYFKLNNEKFIIETDGGWHKQDNKMSGITKEESQRLDNYKDKLAQEHGIKVIRIDCEFSELNFIKNNILRSRVNDIFNLSNIDWLKCEEFALSNLCKKACEIKRNNSKMTTTTIGEIMKLDKGTIRKYLIKGTKLGWCEYDKDYEKRSSLNKGRIKKRKPVEIFKDGISLGIFPSCAELERQSEELFGVKLDYRNISSVCLDKVKTHKGFTFKYTGNINDEIVNII